MRSKNLHFRSLCYKSIFLTIALVLVGGIFSSVYADIGENELVNIRNRIVILKEKVSAGITIGEDELLLLENMQQQLSAELKNQRLRSSDTANEISEALLKEINVVKQLSSPRNNASDKTLRSDIEPRADTTPPQITSFTITPSVVNLSGGSQIVTFMAFAQDDISGVKEMVVWFDKKMPNGYSLIGLYGFSDTWDDGSSAYALSFPQSTASGTYNITSIDVTDKMNNKRTYYPSDLSAKGFPISLTVQSGSSGDTNPPQITSFTITPSVVNLSGGSQVVSFMASAQDDISGVKEMVVWFDKTMPNGYSLVGLFGYSDTWDDGNSSYTLTFPQTAASGTYNITSIDVTDKMSNKRTYYPSDLSTKGFPISFQVTTTSTSDTRIINLSGNLAFGSVTANSTATMTLTIGNIGNSMLTVSSISYPIGFSGNWSGGTIAAGSFQNVIVTFVPTSAQSYSGTVTVNSNKTSGTNTTAISGMGTSPNRIISISGGLAFGNVQLNTTKQLAFTIQNSGNSTMTVSSISYPTGFSGNWSGGTIAAGASQTVTVIFMPTTAQTYSGTVTVYSDKTGGTNTASISGTGAVSNYTISGYVRDSGSSLVGLGGVVLTFSNSGGSATTDSSGYYSKTVNSGWSGTVTASKSGYSFTPPSLTYSNVLSDQNNQDYTGTMITYIISGYVRKSSDNSGINGVTLNFSNYGGSAITNSSGYYSKAINYNWNGMVTPVIMTGYTFSPINRSYSNLTMNQSDQNYTATSTAQPNISVTPKSLVVSKPKSSRSIRENAESVFQSSEASVQDALAEDSSTPSTGYGTGLVIPDEVREHWKTNMPSLKFRRDNLPTSKDWSIYDSPVRNQKSCGSCWAFTTIALMENLANQANLPVDKDFAEQVLVSCLYQDRSSGRGCTGGWYYDGFNYIQKNGLPAESCYPYKAWDMSCGSKCSNPNFMIKIKQSTPSECLWGENYFTADDLRGALQEGPLAVAMYVPDDFFGYSGGIYKYKGGNKSWGHAVLVVAYNDAERYFKVKNSWGTGWGEGGYFRISYDDVTSAMKFGSYAATASGIYIEGQQTSFTIANTGSGNLTVNSISCDQSWLYFSQQSSLTLLPGEQKTISVSVKDWNAVTSEKVAKLTVSSNDPDEPSVIVEVKVSTPPMASRPLLTVSPPFQQGISKTDGKISVDVSGQNGMTEFDISNGSEGTLIWSVTSNNSWLNVTKGSTGSDAGTLDISYDANTTAATRTGTVTISAPGADNSPFTVEIRQSMNSGDGVIGDIDNKGSVDLIDAIIALQVLAGLNPSGVNVGADVNGDQKIGLPEVIYILQKVAGLRPSGT